MGHNEILLVTSSMLCVMLVLSAWKLDRERLHGVILLFLILIALTGGTIVEFFGFATNTGNVFYASIFLATYFLIERYGRQEVIRSIWISVIGVFAFSLLLFLTLSFISLEGTVSVSMYLSAAFGHIHRVAFASVAAYLLSQTLNVVLYTKLKETLEGNALRMLWLRINITNALAQLVDSVVFFMIAFWGVVPLSEVWEIIATGFVIKVVFIMIFSPLLYFNRIEEDMAKGYASITMR